MRQQLLCTFTVKESLELTIDYLKTCFEIQNNTLYLYSEEDSYNNYVLVYNIDGKLREQSAKNTILIHRKKQTNTLYTINALNELIKKINNGALDKSFQIDWGNYSDSMLLYRDSLIITPLYFEKKIQL